MIESELDMMMEMLAGMAVFLFLYGLAALIVNAGMAAYVAESKNYQPVAWFFLTLFFPMALFAVIGLPVKEKKDDPLNETLRLMSEIADKLPARDPASPDKQGETPGG